MRIRGLLDDCLMRIRCFFYPRPSVRGAFDTRLDVQGWVGGRALLVRCALDPRFRVRCLRLFRRVSISKWNGCKPMRKKRTRSLTHAKFGVFSCVSMHDVFVTKRRARRRMCGCSSAVFLEISYSSSTVTRKHLLKMKSSCFYICCVVHSMWYILRWKRNE